MLSIFFLFFIGLEDLFDTRKDLTANDYANAGMWLFFNVNLYQDAGEFMDENISYEHFDTAFFSLFRQVCS